jgi:hypothetical protein
MRSHEMEPGEPYALHSNRRTKVTVLETPPEVRRAARVRVRFETGVKAGKTTELPSRRIAAPWNGEPPAKAQVPSRETPRAAVERLPEVGEQVTLASDKAGFVWTVDGIDEQGEKATVSTIIFERPTTRTVAVDQLRVCAEESRSHGAIKLPFDDGERCAEEAPSTLQGRAWAAANLRPERPKRELEKILDQLLFSPGCLAVYRRRLAPDFSGTALSDRLREEILRSGFVMRAEPSGSGEYARLRVPNRFDVVLTAAPDPERPMLIEGLYFPAKKSARRGKRGAQRRRAA